jgi:hypothetical protein
MNWDLVRLFPDFGCVVLVYIVQLTIYPSFLYYSQSALDNWHSKYTRRISIVVMPLMLSQLFLNTYILFDHFSSLNLISFGLILGIWIITFFQAVPLHNSLNIKESSQENIRKLIRVNGWRCFFWTLAMMLNVWSYLQS